MTVLCINAQKAHGGILSHNFSISKSHSTALIGQIFSVFCLLLSLYNETVNILMCHTAELKISCPEVDKNCIFTSVLQKC